jgi:hypothetical protein
VSAVGALFDSTETFIEQQPLTDADRRVISLDDRKDEDFRDLCQAVASLRLLFSVSETARNEHGQKPVASTGGHLVLAKHESGGEMGKKWTKKECFPHYGVKPRNLRWSWSGRSPDGKTVAVAFWQDRFLNGGRVYRSSNHAGDETWFGSAGHTELIENLVWARDNCDGLLRIIVGIAKDTKQEPRSTLECFPQDRLVMRITHLDESTCDFVTERVEQAA